MNANKPTSLLATAVAILFGLSATSTGVAQDARAIQEMQVKLLQNAPLPQSPFPSFDSRFPPPVGFPQPFELSQKYPSTYADDTFPWMEIDFAAHPHEYLRAVLAYCLEGNLDIDFRVAENPIRKWFHAPWMHDDGEANGAGREYHHGLTRERRSRAFELHKLQKSRAQN